MPIPLAGFDPTETGVPWDILQRAGVSVVVATPGGEVAHCDEIMLTGRKLGPLAGLLAADRNGKKAFDALERSPAFLSPLAWEQIVGADYDGLLLPGGHAPEVRQYLESQVLQKIVAEFFGEGKPVGAICHGVVLAARSRSESGDSVLKGRKTTALLSSQEFLAWMLTGLWLGRYYRTYPQTVEAEVKSCLASPRDFLKGAFPFSRDTPERPHRGFVVRDDNYLSARWPGDAHHFGESFLELLSE